MTSKWEICYRASRFICNKRRIAVFGMARFSCSRCAVELTHQLSPCHKCTHWALGKSVTANQADLGFISQDMFSFSIPITGQHGSTHEGAWNFHFRSQLGIPPWIFTCKGLIHFRGLFWANGIRDLDTLNKSFRVHDAPSTLLSLLHTRAKLMDIQD